MKKRIMALGLAVLFCGSFIGTEIYIEANKPAVFPRPVVTVRDYESRLEDLQLAYQAAKTDQDRALIRDIANKIVTADDISQSAPFFKNFYNQINKPR